MQIMCLCEAHSIAISDCYYLKELSGTSICGICNKAQGSIYELTSKARNRRKKPKKPKAQYREPFRDWPV